MGVLLRDWIRCRGWIGSTKTLRRRLRDREFISRVPKWRLWMQEERANAGQSLYEFPGFAVSIAVSEISGISIAE